MKVIWLTNVATQMVDSIINENKRSFFGGGWLDGLSERLLSDKSIPKKKILKAAKIILNSMDSLQMEKN